MAAIERERPKLAPEELLKTTFAHGAHKTTPLTVRENTWQKMLGITISYHTSSATMEEIGEIYGLTREGVRRNIHHCLQHLLANCPPPIRKELSSWEIVTKKPFFANPRSPAFGLTQGLKAGQPIRHIQQDLDLAIKEIGSYRQRLKPWGIEVPPLPLPAAVKNRQLAEQLEKARNPKTLQRLLNRVSSPFYKKHTKGENPLLLPVRQIAFDFHYREITPLLDILKEAGVPVGEIIRETVVKKSNSETVLVRQRYSFVLTAHGKWARQVFEEAPDLQKYREDPLRQICGPSAEPPKRTKSQDPSEFRSPTALFAKMGISITGRTKFNLVGFFQGCPVPVWRYQNKYLYPAGQEESLCVFIKEKLNL